MQPRLTVRVLPRIAQLHIDPATGCTRRGIGPERIAEEIPLPLQGVRCRVGCDTRRAQVIRLQVTQYAADGHRDGGIVQINDLLARILVADSEVFAQVMASFVIDIGCVLQQQ